MDPRVNPFFDRGHWWWRDENQQVYGPFDTQVAALRGLLRHCDKRSRWVIFKELVQEFIAA